VTTSDKDLINIWPVFMFLPYHHQLLCLSPHGRQTQRR
jgi:hypothetical protein